MPSAEERQGNLVDEGPAGCLQNRGEEKGGEEGRGGEGEGAEWVRGEEREKRMLDGTLKEFEEEE